MLSMAEKPGVRHLGQSEFSFSARFSAALPMLIHPFRMGMGPEIPLDKNLRLGGGQVFHPGEGRSQGRPVGQPFAQTRVIFAVWPQNQMLFRKTDPVRKGFQLRPLPDQA
jgi:hypothetical protein